jgi:S-layer protein (TIGR01564 family)
VLKIANKNLAVKAYFGKLGAAATAGTTVHEVVPVTSAVALLDSEVTSTHKAANLVLVGGPCVNTLVAELATAGKFGYTCAGWPARDFGLVQVIDDAFTTGKFALVLAGTRAQDTRMACHAVQHYDTLLKGKTATAVEVTSLSATGIVEK